MPDGSSPPEDNLEQMVAASLTRALETMLRRGEDGDRLTLLRTLRSQMQRVLAEATIKDDGVKAIELRTRMAVLFDTEFARVEDAEVRRLGGSAE